MTRIIIYKGWVREIEVAYRGRYVGGVPFGFIPEGINKGHGGDWVYIKPLYTHVEAEAATGFQITITDKPIPQMKNIARGAGGLFRYIEPQYIKDDQKIIDIHFRTQTGLGFGVCTTNINYRRGGRELFLCWVKGKIMLIKSISAIIFNG